MEHHQCHEDTWPQHHCPAGERKSWMYLMFAYVCAYSQSKCERQWLKIKMLLITSKKEQRSLVTVQYSTISRLPHIYTYSAHTYSDLIHYSDTYMCRYTGLVTFFSTVCRGHLLLTFTKVCTELTWKKNVSLHSYSIPVK